MIDRGVLTSGAEHLGGKCYRYKDFAEQEIRLIGVLVPEYKCCVENGKDIVITTDLESVASDSFDVMSFSDGRVGIVRIGQNVTKDGKYRDVEVISVE